MTANGLRTKQNEESTLVRRGREQRVRRPTSVPCPRSAGVLQQVKPTSFTPGLPPAISMPTQLLTTVHQHPGKEGEASSSGLNAPPAIARPRQHGVGQAPDSGCVLLTRQHSSRQLHGYTNHGVLELLQQDRSLPATLHRPASPS